MFALNLIITFVHDSGFYGNPIVLLDCGLNVVTFMQFGSEPLLLFALIFSASLVCKCMAAVSFAWDVF